MSWMIRTSTAGVLSLAMFALPMVLNQCAAACHGQLSAAAANESACHHSTPSTTRLSPIPTSCGHDHDGAVSTVGATGLIRATASFVGVIVMPVATTAAAAHHLISSSRPPGAGLAAGSPSLRLRI